MCGPLGPDSDCPPFSAWFCWLEPGPYSGSNCTTMDCITLELVAGHRRVKGWLEVTTRGLVWVAAPPAGTETEHGPGFT